MTGALKISVSLSEELVLWLREEAKEIDVNVSALVEMMLRSAFKKIGAGEAVRLGMESAPYTPSRLGRPQLPWTVTRISPQPHGGRMVADELRCGQYRLTHRGSRGTRNVSTKADKREPHGRDDQSLDGWYLTGPGLVSPFVWLGTSQNEAKREASVWGARLPERRGKRTG